jgi:pimeloyl-ACP methyl ester carboxylesterase
VATATVNGLTLAYETIGEGRPWVITPGGRFTKEEPGVRELAVALAAQGNRVLIWDRPNCGESDVCFEGSSESAMQADALVGLLEHLDMTPAVIIGGSGGARVSLLAAAHPGAASGLATWWISGGVYGLLTLAMHYCGGSLAAAWTSGGMEAVADLPEWQEVIEGNAGNRQRILDQDPKTFIAAMERWMLAYVPTDEPVPGLSLAAARALDIPALVFRSGESDVWHTRATSERLAEVLPKARLVDPPWGDQEWLERQDHHDDGIFVRWPLLAPQLLEWQAATLG